MDWRHSNGFFQFDYGHVPQELHDASVCVI
jgi:hypothetical protein